MNTEQIEKILRNTPPPKAPADLLSKLERDVQLPRVQAGPAVWIRPSWTRRWLPALSFATIFLMCVTVIAVQSSVLADLQRGNETMRDVKAKRDALQANENASRQTSAENEDMEGLRKDNLELLKLRSEIGRLEAELQDAPKLRAENAQIKSAIAAAVASRAENEADADAAAKARFRAERIQCVSNMKQIGLAVRIWTGDNNNRLPPNFIVMTNELSTWKVLKCPGDENRAVTSWADVAAGSFSYQYEGDGLTDDDDPRTVIAECPIHHNVALLDGSVQQLRDAADQRLKIVNGRKIFGQ